MAYKRAEQLNSRDNRCIFLLLAPTKDEGLLPVIPVTFQPS